MKTQEEIITKIKLLEDDRSDFFGFIRGELIMFLDFEHAKPFLKEGVKPESWEPNLSTDDGVKARILDYMPFAWGKANDCRGLSAGRSLNHMQAWLWMLGEEAAADQIDNYSHYGKPQLRAICEHFGWDWRQWDDGEWRNDEDGPSIPAPENSINLPFKAAA
jgi:hypothetical protein